MDVESPKTWSKSFDSLTRFRKAHPDRWPTRAEHFSSDLSLGHWCARQHVLFQKGKFLPEQIKRLLRLGFPLHHGITYWDAPTEALLRDQDPDLDIFIWHVEALKAFRAEHPDRWPGSRPMAERRLRRWLERIRKAEREGKLPSYQRAVLTSVGFSFQIPEPIWYAQYDKVKALMAAHPENWRTHLRGPLQRWVFRQREHLKQKTLPQDRLDLLRAMGPDFPSWDVWEKNFQHLKAFRKAHPDRWPDLKERHPNTFPLGQWCSAQRTKFRKKKLNAAHVLALKKLGFPLQASHLDTIWQTQFEHLLAYRKRYPGRWPSQLEEFPPGNPLGDWLTEQRVRFKKGILDPARARQLIDLHVVLTDLREAQWQEKYHALKAWRKMHPDRWPRESGAVSEEERDLAEWVTGQKQNDRKGKLSAERKRTLVRLGIVWDAKAAMWMQFLQRVQAFRRQHRTRWPSTSSADADERKLGEWLWRQKRAMRAQRLEAKHLDLLVQIGFQFD